MNFASYEEKQFWVQVFLNYIQGRGGESQHVAVHAAAAADYAIKALRERDNLESKI